MSLCGRLCAADRSGPKRGAGRPSRHSSPPPSVEHSSAEVIRTLYSVQLHAHARLGGIWGLQASENSSSDRLFRESQFASVAIACQPACPPSSPPCSVEVVRGPDPGWQAVTTTSICRLPVLVPHRLCFPSSTITSSQPVSQPLSQVPGKQGQSDSRQPTK